MILLLLEFNDLVLGGDDPEEGFRVVVVKVDGLLFRVFNLRFFFQYNLLLETM